MLPTKNILSNVVAFTKVLASFEFLPLELLSFEFRPFDPGFLVFAVVLSVMMIPVHIVVVWMISNQSHGRGSDCHVLIVVIVMGPDGKRLAIALSLLWCILSG